ncbi:hypothetical protein RF11_14918 [Thelohanellus kitauei]|uniref:Tc1-like transposase DDE domain-containing protein n=1 Tax=Thelohanellus kitauei TaxID=669202 RepID=A0A0C2J4R1_THEKT|nr:hypothetical protein RF11_14918 [Thelohanellus kitauei]
MESLSPGMLPYSNTNAPKFISLNESEGVISIEPLSIKLNRSVSVLWDAGHSAFFKTQDHPFNQEHFCGYFIEAFEQFFSSGIHESIFIMDNEEGRWVIYLPPYSPFLIQIENLLPKWKNIVKPESPRLETDLFNQVAQ